MNLVRHFWPVSTPLCRSCWIIALFKQWLKIFLHLTQHVTWKFTISRLLSQEWKHSKPLNSYIFKRGMLLDQTLLLYDGSQDASEQVKNFSKIYRHMFQNSSFTFGSSSFYHLKKSLSRTRELLTAALFSQHSLLSYLEKIFQWYTGGCGFSTFIYGKGVDNV